MNYLSIAGAFTVACVSVGTFAEPKESIVHLDEMDHLAQRTALFNEGAGVEEARYGCLTLSFSGEKGTPLHKNHFRIERSPRAKEWSLYARFRIDGKDNPHEFGLKLYFGDPKNPETRLVTLREEGSSIEGGPAPAAPSEGMPGFLHGYGEAGWGAWNSLALTVEDGAATLWTTRGGRLFKECTGSLPKLPLVGWNLVATAEKSKFRFDRLMVVDGVARPYERGDLQDVLAGMKTAEPDAWDASFGKAMTPGETVEADLAKQDFEAKFRAPFTTKTKESPAVGCAFELVCGDKSERIAFSAGNLNAEARYRVFRDGKFVDEKVKSVITNGIVSVSGSRQGIHAVPPVAHWNAYESEEINEVIAAADVFRRPAERVYGFKVQRVGETDYRILVNGQVLRTVKASAPVTGVRFTGGEGAEARCLLTDAASAAVATWPLQVADGGFRLERVRENLGTFMLECNHYLSRDAFENLPSSCLWNVPRKQWARAKARCRIDPEAAEGQVPVITARLTHFYHNGGRSHAMCEESVDLSKDDPRVKRIGDEYEVMFDFDIASIMDLTSMKDGLHHDELPYLHFEFTGPVWRKNNYYIDSVRSPDEELRSSVIVLSGSLEESPVWFRVTPERPYSLYYPGETPKVNIALRSLDGRRYTLEAETTSWKGANPCLFGVQRLATDSLLEQSLELPVSPTLPYYRVGYRVLDERGAVLQKYETSYGLLPENTREAGYDSPFYSWNFRGAHGTAPKFEDWAPAYDYLGVKRTLLDPKRLAEGNAEVQAHGFTQAEFPYIGVKGDDEKSMNEAKARMRALVAAFPHCKQALVFHESGGGPFPKELYGETTELDDWAKTHQSNKVVAATRTIKCWREVDPSVKMIIGNSADSYGLIAELMRGGLDKSLVDSWGEESVGMTMPPEMSTAYTPWCVKRLAKIYGYTDHMDCPWEWKCRTERYERSFRAAAAVNLRDALIGFALGYTTIPVNCGTEIANSYADTIWCSGPFSRWPMAYPRENALAVATETLVLDRAKFVRQLETGSLTAYALEFQGKRGEWIYTLWTARGETSMKIAWQGGVKEPDFEVVTMIGERYGKRCDSVAVSDEPVYLVTKNRIDGFETRLSRTFRHERSESFAANRTVEAFDRIAGVTLDISEDCRIDPKFDANPFRPGRFAVRDVEDDEKGACIELEHLSQDACPEIMNEYVHLRLKEPVLVEQPFDTIGVWVKGNSSWGRVTFEITDAEGEKWYSSGMGGVGCYVYDWPAKLAFNYDGWNFLQAPLTPDSDVRIEGPGGNAWLWTRDGSGNGRIDWPVKVTAVGVSQYGRTLDLLEMKKSAPTIRLKGIAVR